MAQDIDINKLRSNAKLPVKSTGSTVAQFFELNKATIKSVLPRHVTPERMLKIALGAIRTTPKLQEATSESLFGAVVTCAQMGLEPNTPNGHAYLIPFRNNKKNRTDVQVIIGYRGLIDLARRSGQIVSISAHAVRQNDEFSYEYGLDEHCKHVPAPSGDRGDITHFYAVAKLVGGGYAFEVLSKEGVEKIRDGSQNWKTAVRYNNTGKSIWTLHFEEMGRKTLIRRLYKYLPTSIEMARGSELDSSGSTGEAQELDQALTGDFTVVTDGGGMSDDGAEGPEEIINQKTGEVFDPEIHVAPDRTNKDGSYTKRPHRAGKASQAEEDPKVKHIEALKHAGTLDELSNAFEMTNGPHVKLSEADLTEIHKVYDECEAALRSGGDNEDPGAGGDFDGME